MAYIHGEGRNQGTLFPVVLDDLVAADHMCRVVDAFVGQLHMDDLGFERAQPAETGRPGYDPRTLLELYLYGTGLVESGAIRLQIDKIWPLSGIADSHPMLEVGGLRGNQVINLV
jgi:hypothetical protein